MKMDVNKRGKEDKNEWDVSSKTRERKRRKKKNIEQEVRRMCLISCLYPKKEGASHDLSTVETSS